MDQAKRMLGFVLMATIIGSHQSTRHAKSAHSVAIGVRRLRLTATPSISFIVGDRGVIRTKTGRAGLGSRSRVKVYASQRSQYAPSQTAGLFPCS